MGTYVEMKCQKENCGAYFNPEKQSAVCPHKTLEPPAAMPGGPRLRLDVKAAIDDAFAMKDVDSLRKWSASAHSSIRRYAETKLMILLLRAKEEVAKELKDIKQP